MAVTADQVVVQLQAQTAQYEAGMRKAAGEAERFEKQALAVVVAQTREARALYESAKATTAKGSAEIKSAAAALQAAKSTEAATRAEIAHAAALRQMAVAADTAHGRLNNIQGSAGGIAAQFNDIGVTAAAGMNPLLIALQQGTQLTQGFAGQSTKQVLAGLGSAFAGLLNPVSLLTIGLVAGTAALIQWTTNALTAGEDTAKLAEATENLAKAAEDFRITSDAIRFGIDEAEVVKVRELNSLMAQLAAINERYANTDNLGTRQRLSEEARLIKAQIADVQVQLDGYRQAREELARVEAAAQSAGDKVAFITENVGAAVNALAVLVASAPQEGWLQGAINDAAKLVGTLASAAQFQATVKISGSGSAGVGTNATGGYVPPVGNGTVVIPKIRSAGGGGGGANPDAAEAKRVIAETRTEAEKLVIEMEKLQRLKDAGLIDAETFERAKNAMQELSPIAKNVSNALKTAFDGIFDDADAALESLGKKLLMLALKMQLAQLMPNVFGANGIVPLVGAGYAGGGYTGPGGVNQAAGVVHKGEVVFSQSDVARNGGVDAVEAMRLGLRGYAGGGAVNVPTMGIAGSYGGGSSVTVIDQRGAGAPAIETQTTRGPNGRDMVTMWVKEDMARGKFNGPMNGVYGQKPQKVTR